MNAVTIVQDLQIMREIVGSIGIKKLIEKVENVVDTHKIFGRSASFVLQCMLEELITDDEMENTYIKRVNVYKNMFPNKFETLIYLTKVYNIEPIIFKL